ncbi:uncharacterized protein ACBT44_003278 isoform 2-T6 [Syngnathus typhle]
MHILKLKHAPCGKITNTIFAQTFSNVWTTAPFGRRCKPSKRARHGRLTLPASGTKGTGSKMATLHSSHGFMGHLQTSELWLERRPVMRSIRHWCKMSNISACSLSFCPPGGAKGPRFRSRVKIYMVLILWHQQPLVEVTINLALFKDTYPLNFLCLPLPAEHFPVRIQLEHLLPAVQRQRWLIQVQKVKSLPQIVFNLVHLPWGAPSNTCL